jgi:general secretion pathway protein D
MKIIKNLTLTISFFLFLLSISTPLMVYCEDNTDETTNITTEQEPTVSFNYENENLVTIINELAALKNLNVILPQGDALATTVTLHIEKKITLTQAWTILNTFLDVAGYFIVPQGSIIRIVKNGKDISREPMPTYIGVNPDDLPNNDQPIRYMYYLANIRISAEPDNELNGILKDLLPDNVFIKGDSITNGLLLVAKANDIRAAMKIIIELDKINFQEKIDIIPLRHTSATIVAHLINEQLVKSENANPYRLDTKKAKEIPYFSGFTKIIPEVRLNKLIILGRPQAVERLKDFIKKYIDVAPDSGESILHIYHLQYLDARAFAPVLERIVQGSENGGPSQASAGESAGGGTERFFDKVIVHTDYPTEAGSDNANASDKIQHYTYYGGNNLVVAARNDDWKQIKKLIEELDTPQRQVLIEILIADLTVEDTRILGAMMRMPDKVPLPDSIQFQAAQLNGPPIPSGLPTIPPAPGTVQTTINSDLLSQAYNSNNGAPVLADPTPGTSTLANFALAGTTMLSLNDNDGNTWSIWELLQFFTNSKILSHPHVVTRNNKTATVELGQTRWLTDKVKDVASNYYGGATTIQNKPITASLKVYITPRVSTSNTVNLQVLIDIDEFVPGSNTILLRKLETNANIKSGGIFALGGLIRTTSSNTITQVPILGKIPILGWFFKSKNNDVVKNNLTVFISPTIIEPRLREGINEYTQDYVNVAKAETCGNLFDSLKDPITHWFFTDTLDTAKAIDKFVAKDETLPANDITIKKRTPKKSSNSGGFGDSTDILTHAPDGTIARNDQPLSNDVDNFVAENNHDQLHEWKKILEKEPNPFLKA